MSAASDVTLDTIKTWIQNREPSAPLLVSSNNLVSLAELVQSLIDWAGQSGWAYSADIINCQPIKHTIPIAKIKQVLGQSSYAPLSKRKIIIIQQAEKLSLPAASSLLKSLEDAPSSTRYLLTARSRRSILPTILSRCQKISLTTNPLPPANTSRHVPLLDQTLLSRLSHAPEFNDNDLLSLTAALCERLRAQGPDPQLKNALTRIRDYYMIRSIKGNEKLAKDVLLASLP